VSGQTPNRPNGNTNGNASPQKRVRGHRRGPLTDAEEAALAQLEEQSTQQEVTLDDARLVCTAQAVRALIRRRELTAARRRDLSDTLWLLESCARDRGLDTSGWRPYPGRGPDAVVGSVRVTADGELIEWLPRGRKQAPVTMNTTKSPW
jgi:hypothetical protein